MAYDISTMFIWRFFAAGAVCPTCMLKQKTENDIADGYLNAAVMEDDERMIVNKRGFCERHFNQLLSGRNKLGLALQADTRVKYLKAHIPDKITVKNAEKCADKIADFTKTCVVCDKVEFNMARYYKTVCALYGDDEKFREENFKSVKGFCLTCYARLLKNAKYAKKHAQRFIDELSEKQAAFLSELDDNLTEFSMCFDHRSAHTPSKDAAKSLNLYKAAAFGLEPVVPDRK